MEEAKWDERVRASDYSQRETDGNCRGVMHGRIRDFRSLSPFCCLVPSNILYKYFVLLSFSPRFWFTTFRIIFIVVRFDEPVDCYYHMADAVHGNGAVSISFNHAKIRNVNEKNAAPDFAGKMGVRLCTIPTKFGCQWNSLTLQRRIECFFLGSSCHLHWHSSEVLRISSLDVVRACRQTVEKF